MTDRYDLSRVSREMKDAFLREALMPTAGPRFSELLHQLREQAHIPLRTRSEVEAEIGRRVRESVLMGGRDCLNSVHVVDGDERARIAAIRSLCAEPTAEEPEPEEGETTPEERGDCEVCGPDRGHCFAEQQQARRDRLARGVQP